MPPPTKSEIMPLRSGLDDASVPDLRSHDPRAVQRPIGDLEAEQRAARAMAKIYRPYARNAADDIAIFVPASVAAMAAPTTRRTARRSAVGAAVRYSRDPGRGSHAVTSAIERCVTAAAYSRGQVSTL